MVGGDVGAQIIGALVGGGATAASGGRDIGTIVGQVASGVVEWVAEFLMVIIGLIKQAMGGQKVGWPACTATEESGGGAALS